MTVASWLQLVVLVVLLGLCTRPLGAYMAKVFDGDRAPGDRLFLPIERLVYRVTGADPEREQRWTIYAASLLAFSFCSVLFLYVLQRVQGSLPVNPTKVAAVPAALAWNTAVSFVTNTNWQNYAAENTMSHLTQMVGLAVQNFVSAAVGIAVAIALVRGLIRRRSNTIGNFWVDITRATVRILIPIAFLGALVLVSQGVVQNLRGNAVATTLEGLPQVMPGGPAREPGGDQGARHQRGRLLQRQLRPPALQPQRLHEPVPAVPDPRDPVRPHLHLRPDDQETAPGLGGVRGDVRPVDRERVRGHGLRGRRQPQVGRSRRRSGGLVDPSRRERRGQGAPFRTGRLRAVRGDDHRYVDGCRERGARQFHARRRSGSAGEHDAGRGEPRRGGDRPVRHADLRDHRRVHRRAHGRAHAGVPGQEDPGRADEAPGALHPGHAPGGAGLRRRLGGARHGQVVDPQRGAPRALRGDLCLHLGREQQRFGVRRPHRQHRLVQHHAGAGHAGRSVPPDRAGARHRRVAGPPTAGAAVGRDVPHRHAPVHRPVGRRRADRRRPHLLPRPGARSHRRASRPVRDRHGQPCKQVRGPRSEGRSGPGGPGDPAAGGRRQPRQARPRHHDPQPTDVRGRDRQRAHHAALPPGPRVKSTGSENLFAGLVAAWLWFTVLFANFAEAVAEGRGKAQADTLRKARTETVAHRRAPDGSLADVRSSDLGVGDEVVCRPGDVIPSDGEVVEGIASVDESAITGESAPVIRESGGDRSAVTGGTKVLSDEIVVRITAKPGETFLDRMIALVEGASRQKTPNEIALNILLAGLTIIFLLATVTLQAFAIYSGGEQPVIVLVALLVCLIPTTIGALLSAIGIAGMDRLIQRNVMAMSGRSVEAAGDCSTLLLDKTGTITLGNRQAAEFLPLPGIAEHTLAEAAQLSSMADETPEGRSIVILAKERFNLRERDMLNAQLVPFTAQTRMSGVDLEGRLIRKGAGDSVRRWVEEQGGDIPAELGPIVEGVARGGGTPLVVAEGGSVLGVIHLKDVLKEGMVERFAQLRAMGIRTVMITGDNPLTAKAIASEAGVDDFLAEATPEDKMALIRKEQAGGRMVAMTGDGTNDAPALAQADVGVAMNTGTQAAKEAGNMVDLDSNPTKLIEVVEIGKQLLITRGSLTTFSIANDVAKYFAIIPAMFVGVFPQLDRINVMNLASPRSAILSAVIFNALIIVALIPLALRGVKFRAEGAAVVLRRNMLVYGVGGIVAPFVGIKLIDIVVNAMGVS